MTVNSDDCGSKVNFNYKYISHLAGLIILCDECIILCVGGAMKTQGTEKSLWKIWSDESYFISELPELVARKVKKNNISIGRNSAKSRLRNPKASNKKNPYEY